MRRTLRTLLTASLVLTGAAVVPDAAASPQAIDWQPCGDGVDCATIPVPLDWSDPNGETIQIGLARRRATNPEARIGSLLIDPGGPGGSGVNAVTKNQFTFPDAITERFDLVGFDPRGINTSTQVLCDHDLTRQALDARHPTNQAEFDLLADLNRQLFDSCRRLSGALVDHVDTQHVVRDMDAIRAALGERKLTYVGYSYGSLMGQQYAETFPERIRAMVMDGNMDHSIDSTWEFLRSGLAATETNFHAFARWCGETANCALHGRDIEDVVAELWSRIETGELTNPETGAPVDYYLLSRMLFSVNFRDDWRTLATRLAALHDGSALRAAGPLAGTTQNPYPAIFCGDWDFEVADYAEYAALRKRAASTFPNIQWSTYADHVATCIGNPTATTNPQHPLRITGAPPLVMIGNIHDPATVYEWSRTAARQSGAHLVTYEGWGHTAYHGDGPSQCVNEAIDTYLIHLRPPRRGLSCPATEEPVAVTSSAGPYQP
jgi:pimeloyl-ACP methyl ester carboxylesterase